MSVWVVCLPIKELWEGCATATLSLGVPHLESEPQRCHVPGMLLLVEPVAPEGFTVRRQLLRHRHTPMHLKKVHKLQLQGGRRRVPREEVQGLHSVT